MPNSFRSDPNAALECPPGADYDEETFRYLLSVERAHAERANRAVRLVCATLEPTPGEPVPIPPATAARLFEGLKTSLRETDVTGWYRQHHVAGAVLSDRADRIGSDVSSVIQQRVNEGLRQRLPSKDARSLCVRVVPF